MPTRTSHRLVGRCQQHGASNTVPARRTDQRRAKPSVPPGDVPGVSRFLRSFPAERFCFRTTESDARRRQTWQAIRVDLYRSRGGLREGPKTAARETPSATAVDWSGHSNPRNADPHPSRRPPPRMGRRRFGDGLSSFPSRNATLDAVEDDAAREKCLHSASRPPKTRRGESAGGRSHREERLRESPLREPAASRKPPSENPPIRRVRPRRRPLRAAP
jgi:hypothetical protein